MATLGSSVQPPDVLGELAGQLLGCGAVLSQMISHMEENQATGKSAPDAAPVPIVARELVRDVITDLTRRHSAEEIEAAAAIVGEATDAICRDIFLVAPDSNLRATKSPLDWVTTPDQVSGFPSAGSSGARHRAAQRVTRSKRPPGSFFLEPELLGGGGHLGCAAARLDSRHRASWRSQAFAH